MASSDDEGELVPSDVSDYEFVSSKDEPISFSKLFVVWKKGEIPDGKRKQIFLKGKTDNGLQKIYKEVVGWKFDLSYKKPEISVLSIEDYWIKLLKPRHAYRDIIRTVQITVNFLHFVKRNPQESYKAMWDYLNKTFSFLERRPARADLENHMSLINEAVERDETLAKSKLLSTFLEEKPRKRKAFDEDVRPSFIVDNVNENEDQEADGSGDDESDEDDCFDSVCAICDNGGNIYICEGKCMRSFHATAHEGEESNCESLGFTDAELEAIKNIDFYCKNCELKKHQCFACGKLGSSDESSGAEVFCCVNGACGHFYHPECVARLLHPGNAAAAEEHRKKIATGEQFSCPVHKCHACKELEVRADKELQFAICRRCPRAYHRKCLPREIAFEEDVDEEKGIVQRAWAGLIPNRILIYCLKHEIDPEIYTPVRDHIKFPGVQPKNKRKLPLGSSSIKDPLNERVLPMEDNAGRRVSAKPAKGVEKVSSGSKQSDPFRKKVEKLPSHEPSKKQSVAPNKKFLVKSKQPTTDEGEKSLGNKLYDTFYGTDSEPEKSSRGASIRDEQERTRKVKPITKRIDNSVTLDADARKRILTLMKDASSSITLDQIKQRHKAPSTHVQHSKFSPDNITLGKVEGSVQALRAALKKLNEGGSLQDAKAVCGNDLLVQVMRWKDKLRVYLAPFLYGMRYTSFGRHFTQTDKLKEIVEMLHWYTRDGDMIVDFCCGSNDFSCIMKKKLDETGKKCSYKNYDILRPKNDFNFERRDWMKVREDDLPEGSRLIMGLNPPFGVNASLANKFIDKALEFKPKLVILIVPRETQRLDEKNSPYDLVWEDDQMCSGKAFYLPGSVDVNDKQIDDWNLNAPVLSLWSHRDWTLGHKAIAEEQGHLSGIHKKHNKLEEIHNETHELNSLQQEFHNLDVPLLNQGEEGIQHPGEEKNQDEQEAPRVTTSHKEESVIRGTPGTKGNNKGKRNHSEENSNKSGGKRKKKRRSGNNNMSGENKNQHSGSRHPSPNIVRPPQFDQRNLSRYNNGNDGVDDLVKMYGHEQRMGFPGFGDRPSTEHMMGGFREDNFGYNIPQPHYPGPPRFPSSYGQLNPGPNHTPTYGGMNNTSAMSRYAPRLDELNHGQMNNMVSGPPMLGPSGAYHTPAPRPGSLGFAPGPYRPYPHQSSTGWLNE